MENNDLTYQASPLEPDQASPTLAPPSPPVYSSMFQSLQTRPKGRIYDEEEEWIANLWEEMRDNGIEPPEYIIVDDEIHRFTTKQGTNGGFYGFHEGEFGFYGMYGDHSTGDEPEYYQSFNAYKLTEAQFLEFNAVMSVLKNKYDIQQGITDKRAIPGPQTPTLYTFYMNDVQMPRKDRPEVWSAVSEEGKPEFMYRGYPLFDKIPDGTTEPRRYGDFIIDIDTKEIACGSAIRIIEWFEKVFGVEPDQWRVYLSGKKGVHLELPSAICGLQNGHVLLPLGFKRLAKEIEGELQLSLDTSAYSMGCGRPFRQPNVMRDTGTCKRQIPYVDLFEIETDEEYRNACKKPGPLWQPDNLATNPSLAQKIQEYIAAAEEHYEAIKVAPKLDPDDIDRLHNILPPCINVLANMTATAPKGATFNDVAMQITAYAVTAGIPEERLIQGARVFIENYPSTSLNTIQKRYDNVRARYRTMAANGNHHSCGGILALRVPGFDCKECQAMPKSYILQSAEWEPSIKEWPILDPFALRGLAGEFVALASENSEADPAALLITFLVRFGVEVGSGPILLVGDSKHYARGGAVIVGDSSKARKGTSAKPVDRLFGPVEGSARFSPGPFSSGEGIIYAVRDQVAKWDEKKQVEVIVDPGIDDKRLFILDEEFAGAMAQTKREGNILSMVIRNIWDNGNLDPLTKTNKTTATNAHIGWVSHITLTELHARLNDSEAFNGFANRILWVCARRSKIVPLPEPMDEIKLDHIRQRLVEKILIYRDKELIKIEMGFETKLVWAGKYYAELTKDNPGLVGCVINRAEAQALRLAMLYCLLDGMTTIRLEHLEAALALWRYCEASARYIFHGRQTDGVAEKILAALTERPMTGTEIFGIFANNIKKEQLETALSRLKASGLIIDEKSSSAGKGRRPVLWKIKKD